MIRRLGFTLIELLVVIAIIGVLAAIIFPVFSQVHQKGHQMTCLSNLRQISMATLLYAQDYDDSIPLAGDPGDVIDSWTGTVWENYFLKMKPQYEVLLPYTKSKGIWHCPADIGFRRGDLFPSLIEASSSFIKFGSSYYTQSIIITLQKPISSLTASREGKEIGGVSSIGFYYDAVGYWHGGSKFDSSSHRYNVGYLDGHAKSVSNTDYNLLWSQKIN
jgi:prepilin-type N-terminal cleavage/methylation domain-containing protein/prepilin-type processing-associated H-X9-DG protein